MSLDWLDVIRIFNQPDAVQMSEPPCKYCDFWHTELRGKDYRSVVFCVADEMFSDFSCFRSKENKNG